MERKGAQPPAAPPETTAGGAALSRWFWNLLLGGLICGAMGAAVLAVATALGFPSLDPVATAVMAGLAAFVVGALRAGPHHPAWEWIAWVVGGIFTALIAAVLFVYDPWDEPPPLPTSRVDVGTRLVPSGYERVVDETGTISVHVPRGWAERKTTQRLHAPGPLPELLAAENLAVFTRNYLVSGLHLVALPSDHVRGRSPGAALDAIFEEDYERVCSHAGVVEYHEPHFRGRGFMWEDCEGIGTTQYLWEIRAEGHTQYVLLLAVQLTSDADPAILTEVFNSFGFVPGN